MGTLKKDTRSVDELMQFLEPLMLDVHARCLQGKLFFKTVSIISISSNLQGQGKSKTLSQPTQDFQKFSETVKALFSEYLNQNPNLLLRRAGVRLSEFSEPSNQRSLFEF